MSAIQPGEWRSGSAPALGAGGRGFESPLPDPPAAGEALPPDRSSRHGPASMATPGQGAGCAHVAGTARHNGRASAQSEAAYVPLPTTSEPVDARHQATQTAGTSRSVPDLRRRVLVGLAAAVALLASLAGASVGYVAWRLGQVPRVQVPGLSARVGQPYDILIAGSDSRAGLSPAQQAHFGNTQVTAGQR